VRCVTALFLNAQPFGFLVGRRWREGGETFHYFVESLVERVHGLDDFGNLGINICGEGLELGCEICPDSFDFLLNYFGHVGLHFGHDLFTE